MSPLLTPEALLRQGLSPAAKLLDLKGRFRCRTGPAKCCLADLGSRLPWHSGSLSSTSSTGWNSSPASVFASARDGRTNQLADAIVTGTDPH